MSKILFYDLETVGLIPDKCGIHQISLMPCIDNIPHEPLNYHVRIFPQDVCYEQALKIGNVTEELVRGDTYIEPLRFFATFEQILSSYVNKFDSNDKFHLCGYNNRKFDDEFLRCFFDKCGSKYFGSWFWSDSIDCMVLAANKLKDVRKSMPNFKLHTVAKQLGIIVDESKLHDAAYDLELTYQIYLKCQQ